MNKKFTKLIAALALLVFMTPSLVAWGQTRTDQTITLDYNSFGLTTTYAVKTATVDGYSFTVDQGYKGSGNVIQMNSSKGEGILYNTTAIPGLKSITVNVDSGNKTYTITSGTTQNPTANSQTGGSTGTYNVASGDTYFQLKVSGASYFSSIVITYETGGSSTTPTCTVNPTEWDFEGVLVGQTAQKTFTITTANLSGNLSLGVYDDDAFSVSPTTIASTATSTEVTVTFSPNIVTEWEDALVISGTDFSGNDEIEIPLYGEGLCNAPTNPLAYTTPVELTLTNDEVSYPLTPTSNGNGGTITYTLTTNPGSNGEITNGNTFYAIEAGQYVVRATQALSGTTCGGTADITINVINTDPTCTVVPDIYDFGNVAVNTTASHTFVVNTTYLTEALTLSVSNAAYSIAPSTIAQNATSTEVTITFAPTSAGLAEANLLVNGSGFDNKLVAMMTGTGVQPQTITFNAGGGSCDTTTMTGIVGTEITLPTANPSENCATLGWTFAGWATASVSETLTAPTLLSGTYIINGDATLYAVYSVTESDGGGTTTFNFGEIASANDWVNGTAYTTVEISPITLTANGGGNNGKYYTSDNSWRMYSGGSVGITSTSGSITAVSSNPSKTFTINNDGSAGLSCNTTIQFKSIAVTYSSSTTTYNSNPICQLATLDVTLHNIGTNFAENDWSHEIVFNEGSAQLAVGAKVLVSVFDLDDCHPVGESPLTVVDGNNNPVQITFDEGDYSYYFFMPESGATLTATSDALPQSILTVDVDNHVTLEITYGDLSAIVELNDDNTAELCEGVEVTVQVTIGQGYVMQSLTAVGSNGQAILLEEVGNNTYTFAMPTIGATLSATTDIDFPTNLEYALYSGDLVEGDYVIYYNGKAMKNTVSSSRLEYSTVTPSNDVISNPAASIVWHIAPSETEGYWTIYNAAVNKYAAGTGAASKAQLLTSGTDDESLWSVAVVGGNNNTYEFVNKKNDANNVNKNLRNNTTYGFACYSTQTGGALSLYKKVEYASETEIGAYNTTTGAGWHFIASPFVGEISHNVNAGAEGTDLYFYDEQNHMWRNYKNAANVSGFDFANGKGYLYANSENITLQFAGASIVTSETRAINLSYHTTTAGGENNTLAGWNLVGNPFNSNAILDKNCYIISGNAINTEAQTAGNYNVTPGEGVLVKATEAGQSVTFTKVTTGQTSQPEQLQMTVAQQVLSRGTATSVVNDNAIVNFNEGSQLEKFIFNIDAAKLYIPQNDKEYAIVSAEAQGNLPVNFKATEDGNYTITVNPEGVEMNYLHLVDNMTGNDVDLLATPSYTFNATTRDYESRFRLVFAAANNEDGASTGSATFAFMSDGNWIINNAGEATLQVIDLNGRILSSERVNGSVSKTINATPGVYMLRLINGENVMVQKIVVR